jgi:amino acid transporter
MRCPNCGGDNLPGAATCQFCGSHLPAPASSSDRRAALGRVKSSPQYAKSNLPERHAKLPTFHPVHKAFAVVFPLVFVGVALFIFVMMLGMGGIFGAVGFGAGGRAGGLFGVIPLCMAIVPLGMAALGVFMFVTMRKKMQTIETSPVVALPVIVADKRTEVSGGSGDSSATTRYYVTCETEDGERKEYPVWDGNLYGRMAPGDAGIVYLRADHALDFDRVS